MDEKDPSNSEEESAPVVLDAPPWGEFVDPDAAYVRGQAGSLGSGALGGGSCSTLGDFFDVGPDDTAEILAEVHRIRNAHRDRT
jgi:hypothetical protein